MNQLGINQDQQSQSSVTLVNYQGMRPIHTMIQGDKVESITKIKSIKGLIDTSKGHHLERKPLCEII